MEQKEIPVCAEFPNSTRLGGHLFLTLLKGLKLELCSSLGDARGGCSFLVCTAVVVQCELEGSLVFPAFDFQTFLCQACYQSLAWHEEPHGLPQAAEHHCGLKMLLLFMSVPGEL